MNDVSNRQGVVMDQDLRKRIKIAAIDQGITVSQLVRNAVEAYLLKDERFKHGK